jgi:hypothetical protein
VDPKLAEVLSKYEPQLRAAVEAMLAKVQSSASLAQIEAFILQGDIAGLVGYVQKLYAAAAPEMIAVLSAIVAAAGTAAEADIRSAAAKAVRENQRLAAAGLRLMPVPIGSPQMPASGAGITFYGEGKTPDSPGYRFNPINPKTIAATRTWQGNLIQEMLPPGREDIMAMVREGLLAGENPRTTARKIRVGLDLTTSQKGHVENFGATIDEIVAGAKNIDASWGLYTPEMIERMRKDNPVKFRQMNFTPGEIKGGRQWAKISRAAGGVGGQGPIGFQGGGDQMPKTFTTQYMDATGQIRTRTHSFVQTGESAFRVDAKGNPLDGITSFRLRDKRLDPYLYEVMAAKTPEAKAFAQKQLDAVAGQMKKRYHERYTKHRSMVIARTEALRAANLGSYEAWRQALEDNSLFEPGQVRAYWTTAKDDRVRPDHVSLGRKYGRGTKGVPFGTPFTAPGRLANDPPRPVMFPPLDPNCRCVLTYGVDLTPTT